MPKHEKLIAQHAITSTYTYKCYKQTKKFITKRILLSTTIFVTLQYKWSYKILSHNNAKLIPDFGNQNVYKKVSREMKTTMQKSAIKIKENFAYFGCPVYLH